MHQENFGEYMTQEELKLWLEDQIKDCNMLFDAMGNFELLGAIRAYEHLLSKLNGDI